MNIKNGEYIGRKKDTSWKLNPDSKKFEFQYDRVVDMSANLQIFYKDQNNPLNDHEMELAFKSDKIEKSSYQLKRKGEDVVRFKQTQSEQGPPEIIEAHYFKR